MNNKRAIELLHRLQDEQFDGIHGDERREALSMAVRALSGDGDLIYRQDAIDACCFGITHARAFNVETGTVVDLFTEANKELHKAIERIEALPSVQPEVLACGSGELVKDSQRLVEASSNDMISRQQAIEAFEPEHHTDWYTPTIIKTLEELPQAQQDKSCKGCHFEKHGSRACDHCSRMYMDRYEVRNDG